MRHTTKACISCIILIASSSLGTFGQTPDFKNLTRLQKHLLRQITKYGKVESRNIGSTAVYSEQYARFDSLMRISSASDLILFINYPSAAVKVYAFQKLVDHKNVGQAFSALQNNLQDTTAFELQNGCNKGANTVGKSMYTRLKFAIENGNVACTNQQKILLTEIDRKLPSYTDVRKIVARQLKVDKQF